MIGNGESPPKASYPDSEGDKKISQDGPEVSPALGDVPAPLSDRPSGSATVDVDPSALATQEIAHDEIFAVYASQHAAERSPGPEGSLELSRPKYSLIKASVEPLLQTTTEGGGTLTESIGPVLEFFATRVLSHKDSEAKLLQLLPKISGPASSSDARSIDQKVEAAFDPDKILELMDPNVLLPSGYAENTELAMAAARLAEDLETRLQTAVDSNGKPRFLFAKVPMQFPGGKNPVRLMMSCPRIDHLNPEIQKLGLGATAEEAIRLQVMFCKETHEAMRRALERKKRHREASYLLHIGIIVANRAEPGRAKVDETISVKVAPSLQLVGAFSSPDQCRQFIEARLSLLLPDKDCCNEFIDREGHLARVVQQDFILHDLEQFARTVSLYDEYKPIFEALVKLMKVQFKSDVHLYSESPAPTRLTLLALLEKIAEEENLEGDRRIGTTVASIGHGDGILEKFIFKQPGLVARLIGVDKNDQWTGQKVTPLDPSFPERGELVVFDAKQYDLAGNKLDSKSLRQRVASRVGKARVVVAADTFHETDDPEAYFQAAADAVEPGGYLYVSDPTYCELVDNVTRPLLFPYDSSRHPSSMMCIERYLELVAYYKLQGWEVVGVDVVPGTYGGYVDALPRILLEMKKPKDQALKLPRKAGVDPEASINFLDEIFNFWPVSLVPEKKRDSFMDFVRNVIGPKIKEASLNGKNLQAVLVYALLRAYQFTSREPAALENLLRLHPLPTESDELVKAYILDLLPTDYEILMGFMDHLGVENYSPEAAQDVRNKNYNAGLCIALCKLMKIVCNIDISSEMIKTPGWDGSRVKALLD